MELTVDDVWQIADAGDQELQRLARNNRRGNLELGAEGNDSILHCATLHFVNAVVAEDSSYLTASSSTS